MKGKCFCESEAWRNFSLLVLRLVVGAIFIYSGWMKLSDMDMVSGMFASMGWPAPVFFAYLVSIVELVAGVAAVLGVFTKMAGFVLAVVMLVALLAVHVPAQDWANGMLPLTLLGANLVLSAVGGGKWSLTKGCMCK